MDRFSYSTIRISFHYLKYRILQLDVAVCQLGQHLRFVQQSLNYQLSPTARQSSHFEARPYGETHHPVPKAHRECLAR